MFVQTEFLRKGVSLSAGVDYRVDLPDFGMLCAIELHFNGTRNTAYGNTGGDWRVVDKIDKVEILAESSTIIQSLTGKQVQACQWFDTGVFPPSRLRNYATENQFEQMTLIFGRKLFDPEYGLDLSRWNNVELRIANSFTSSHFSALTVDVVLYYMRDLGGANFRGYLRKEEWQTWTTVQAETKYLEIPTLYPVRRIGLQPQPGETSGVADTNPTNLMYNVELTLDTGQVKVFDAGIDRLMRQNYMWFGGVLVPAFPYVQADKGFESGVGFHLGYAHGGGSKDGAAAGTVPTIETGLTGNTLKPESYEGDSPMNLLAYGMAPHTVAVLPFDLQHDPVTWLDPDRRKTVKLDILTRDAASAADGTNRVILERLVLGP